MKKVQKKVINVQERESEVCMLNDILKKFYNEIWTIGVVVLNTIIFLLWKHVPINSIFIAHMLLFSWLLVLISAFNLLVSRLVFESMGSYQICKKPSMEQLTILKILNLAVNILLSFFTLINVNLIIPMLVINKYFV